MTTSPAFSPPAPLWATSSFVPLRVALSARTGPAVRAAPRRAASITMGSEANVATKKRKVAQAKEYLETSQMIFATALDGLTMSQTMKLKDALPETTKVATVKNSLMRRALSGSQWECVSNLTSNSNMWFFVQDDIKGTMKVYEKFVKDLKREAIRGGAFEGKPYDADGIVAIAALPSKQELMRLLGVSIRLVPTKLARGIKMVPTKVGRAVKLAVADEPSEDADESS